jgi:hypothetical protein
VRCFNEEGRLLHPPLFLLCAIVVLRGLSGKKKRRRQDKAKAKASAEKRAQTTGAPFSCSGQDGGRYKSTFKSKFRGKVKDNSKADSEQSQKHSNEI